MGARRFSSLEIGYGDIRRQIRVKIGKKGSGNGSPAEFASLEEGLKFDIHIQPKHSIMASVSVYMHRKMMLRLKLTRSDMQFTHEVFTREVNNDHY